jgi:outer membrane protein OmpA-like peptidoglycan-associated protein
MEGETVTMNTSLFFLRRHAVSAFTLLAALWLVLGSAAALGADIEYTLRVFSSKSADEVQDRADMLKGQGLDPNVTVTSGAGGDRRHVDLGRFPSRAEAESQARRWREEGLLSSYEVLAVGPSSASAQPVPTETQSNPASPSLPQPPKACLGNSIKGPERHLASYLEWTLAVREAAGLNLSGHAAVVREEYPWYRVYLAPVESLADEDGDGVCDDRDRCPGTPTGAVVDEYGCWIAALDTYFDLDRATVKPEYIPRLKQAAEVLNVHPDKKVIVAGNTCDLGTDAYNLNLGRRRAEAVRAYLVQFGVAASRLNVISYGETRPRVDNRTPSGRPGNRRVELHIAK